MKDMAVSSLGTGLRSLIILSVKSLMLPIPESMADAGEKDCHGKIGFLCPWEHS